MLIALVIIVIVIAILVIMYNKLVVLRNNIENSFSDIDVQLKNRFDLIDNLVNTVKGYSTHEKEIFENVSKARSGYINATNDTEKIQSDNMLTGALKTLFAVSENYPDLKANTNFLQLQTELSDLENKVAATRRYYNSSVKEYDNAREVFPSNIIANIFNFQAKEYFQITNEAEKAVPKVNFTS